LGFLYSNYLSFQQLNEKENDTECEHM